MEPKERVVQGIPVSPGVAIGRAFVLNRFGTNTVELRELRPEETDGEVARFRKAVEISRDQLGKIRSQVAAAIDERHADIFLAQAEFLNDPALIERTENAIRGERKNAEYLFNRTVTSWLDVLSTLEDETFRARNSDIVDVANRIQANLAPHRSTTDTTFPPNSVIVATDLAPSETTPLMGAHIGGIALEKGGATSHTAIIAKALEIPGVVGVPDITGLVTHGALVIVDGQTGKVIIDPTPETLAYYEREQASFKTFEMELRELRELAAETIDGYSVTMRANLELLEEAEHICGHGACGIGLFRTEFLFMNVLTPPAEEQQFAIYKAVIEKVAPHPVVFRTLDFGGDKFLTNAATTRELNPFMGQRAIRLCLSNPGMFRAQVRAMLRASAFGPTRILIPMISGVEEFREVKRHIRRAKAELKFEKIPYDTKVQLGAMIEVPSAAVVADDLARECDFFSIGTNDLIQYTLAVDRGNEKVAYLYEPMHPAVLKLLKTTVLAARKNGIPVTVCGEMAADPMTAILLLGLGVDELSMSAVGIPQVKRLIRSINLNEAKLLAEEVYSQSTIEGVHKVVRKSLKKYASRDPRKQPSRPALEAVPELSDTSTIAI
ncbi:MAG: phosphoenolpyruvate--protein phosphotransferase [Candidatus Sumerlaeaceae bacterium]